MSKIDLTQTGVVSAAELLNLRERPLPTAPDGLYDYEANASSSSNGKDDQHSRLYNLVNGFQEAVKRGPPISDPKAIEAISDSLMNPDALDDRKGFFTTSLAAITRLPAGKVQDKLNDAAITLLYNTLPHPPATQLGPATQYRSADGGGNALDSYDRGRAGTSYARSVQGKKPQPSNSLPDPGLVFDTLLKARDFQKHPGQNSSLTFAFASIVTHSLFRTDYKDMTKNNTSSYLDLSPLYGINQATQDAVRNKALGRGLLYPDTFSEERLGFLPSAVSALLVIFSRNHNYIATMLLKINERKRWSDPPPEDATLRAQQDEEIFQTARLVNCGHFMSLIFGDYVAGFLGLPREGSSWSMNPFDPITTMQGQEVTRGSGNQCSVEFNVVYRWHATTAKEDIDWTEKTFREMFGIDGKTTTFDSLTVDDVKRVAGKVFSLQEADPKKRTFGGLKRQADGTFSDDDLAKILQDATEKCAGAYRARGTPEVLRVIEIMGMEQARAWGVCTMNEFRKWLKLKPFTSFEEWSSVPEVADAARKLYKHIDNLELYPGLQAEDCMQLGPGSGICCGYTMTRAILADAIALVRGDRFYTTDFTPANLTSWGIQDCARDPDNGAFGACLPKLLFRHLPRHYPANSAYALFPFFTPEATKQNLTKLGVVDQYDFSRPKAKPIPKVIDTLQAIRYVFNDPTKYKQTYEYDMKALTRGYGFMLTFDDKQRHDTDRSIVMHALFPTKDSINEYTEWYKAKCKAILAEKSFSYDGVPGKYVDIIKDVINLVSVHWAADKLCGIPLKTKANPKGLFTEQEVNDMFVVLFTCVFENVDPEHTWILRHTAQKVGKIVNALIEQSLKEVQAGSAASIFTTLVNTVKSTFFPESPVQKECYDFLGRLSASGKPIDDLVACVIGLAVGSSVNYSQAVAQVVDFYLSDERSAERAELIKVCQRTDAASTELLRGYVREGMRLNPQFGGLFRVAAQSDVINPGQGKPTVNVVPGDIIFASYKNAFLNPTDFPNPLKVDPTRPKDSYSNQGAGFHGCPGVNFAEQTIPELIRIIFTLPNLRRAKGAPGICAGFDLEKAGTKNKMYVQTSGSWSPWPGPLFVTYDS